MAIMHAGAVMALAAATVATPKHTRTSAPVHMAVESTRAAVPQRQHATKAPGLGRGGAPEAPIQTATAVALSRERPDGARAPRSRAVQGTSRTAAAETAPLCMPTVAAALVTAMHDSRVTSLQPLVGRVEAARAARARRGWRGHAGAPAARRCPPGQPSARVNCSRLPALQPSTAVRRTQERAQGGAEA